MRKSVMTLALAGIALLHSPPAIGAQESAGQARPRRVPVTVMMVDRLPQPDAPFLIQRRPDLAPRDVIVLQSDATADQLSDAVRSLLTIRQVNGDTAAIRATMRMRPSTERSRGARRPLPWAQRVLVDLQRAEPKEVAGFGSARAVEIWLPPQRRRFPTR